MSREDANQLKIFAGRNATVLAKRMCDHLDLPLGAARTEVFPDGEVIVKVDEDVRGRDCYVVLSTCTPVNDNLMELLVYIDCLKRASARRVSVVVPYFGYARQDRKDEGRVPITAKLVANLITQAGADRLIAIDLHAAQIQGFFDIPVDHLSATTVFHAYFTSIREELGDLVLVSPDVGNVKVSESFANMLGGELAIIHKRRVSGSEVRTDAIIGNVRDKTVLMARRHDHHRRHHRRGRAARAREGRQERYRRRDAPRHGRPRHGAALLQPHHPHRLHQHHSRR